VPTTTISRCGGGTAPATFQQAIIDSNPNAIWVLNEISGSVANDSSGANHYAGSDGSAPNWAQIVPPRSTAAPHCGSTQGWITDPLVYQPDLSGNFTAAIWWRTFTDPFGTLIGTSVHGGFATGWDLVQTGSTGFPVSKIQIVIGTGVGAATLQADSSYTVNTWYWLVVVHSGTTWTLYVNAVAQAAGYSGAYSSGGNRPVWIGYDNSGSFGLGDGYLSYATLWATRALAASEIASIYAAP
jgi:hypothetical protein